MACDCALPFKGTPGHFTLSSLFANGHIESFSRIFQRTTEQGFVIIPCVSPNKRIRNGF